MDNKSFSEKIKEKIGDTVNTPTMVLTVAVVLCIVALFGIYMFMHARNAGKEETAESSTPSAMASDPSDYIGLFSGYYDGINEKGKKEKRYVDIYIAACDENGQAEGIADINYGEDGFYHFTAVIDFDTGDIDLTQDGWLSDTNLQKKITMHLNYGYKTCAGYVDGDKKRKVYLERYSGSSVADELKEKWENKDTLAEKYDKEDSGNCE